LDELEGQKQMKGGRRQKKRIQGCWMNSGWGAKYITKKGRDNLRVKKGRKKGEIARKGLCRRREKACAVSGKQDSFQPPTGDQEQRKEKVGKKGTKEKDPAKVRCKRHEEENRQ